MSNVSPIVVQEVLHSMQVISQGLDDAPDDSVEAGGHNTTVVEVRETPLGHYLISSSQASITNNLFEAAVHSHVPQRSSQALKAWWIASYRRRLAARSHHQSTATQLLHGKKSDALPPAIAANWTEFQRADLGPEATVRIFHFAKESAGWHGVDSSPLSADSLAAFLAFWAVVREHAGVPELALSRRGQIQAEWHENWQRHLEVKFSEGKQVLFHLVDRKDELTGSDNVNGLARILAAKDWRPLKWGA